ncbi:MAG: site-2 protease family protein [bacterium]|nr:site-2 protease family protein [bacterium]
MQPRANARRKEQRFPGSVNAVTLFGVPIRFHFTFILLLVFLLFIGFESPQSALSDVIFVGALFASVLLHELGHAVVAKRRGVRTIEIVLFPIGGIARLERPPKAREELWIASAGPLVNLVIAGIILTGVWLFRDAGLASLETLAEPTDANLLERIAFGNLILVLFNLLPAFPMDGGRILRSILAIWRTEEEATQIASRAGRILAVGMGLYGLLEMQYMLIFIAFFVYLGATQESQAALGRSLTQGLPVRTAMVTKFHTLSHGDTIGDAARLMLETSQQDFPVLHGEAVIGLLDRNTLLRALAAEGTASYLAGVMDRDYLRLSPDTDLAEALPLLANSGPVALVMEGDRLLGLLTKENLSEFLVLRRFGMPAAPPPPPPDQP